MTLLDEQPTTETSNAPLVASLGRGGDAIRFAARLARRETRRRPGRTLLAALLIAVPVAAMTLGSALVRTDAEAGRWDVRFASQYGTADVVSDPWLFAGPADGDRAPRAAAEARTLDYVWTDAYVHPADGSAARFATVTDLPLSDPMVADTVEVLEGRIPVPGEVLIGVELAEAWQLEPGDELALDRPSGTWTVAGTGRYRSDHSVELLVIPGFDRDRVVDDARRVVQLWDLPDGAADEDVRAFAAAVGGMSRVDDPYADDAPAQALAWGWMAGALALTAVGIIVAAAFATSARRQLVMVGQLTANGATERTVRRTLALQGTWTAGAGAALGLVAGLIALPASRGLIERIARKQMPSWQITLGDLVVVALTAIVAGTIAATVPARSAARVPVLSALAGHRPVGAPSRRLVPVGLALVAGGLGVLVVAATGAREDHTGSALWPMLVVLGSVAVVFGMVCATPLVVERLGRLGRRAPLSLRLALRSLDRTRARSTAVIAAIAVTVGGSVAAAAIVEHSFESDTAARPYLPSDTVIVYRAEEVACCDGIVDEGPLAPIAVPTDLADRLGRLLPNATTAPLLVATYDPPAIEWATYVGPYPDRLGPIVATPEMLDVLGLDPADESLLDAGDALLVQPPGWSVYGTDGVSFVYPRQSGDLTITPVVSGRSAAYAEAFDRPIVSPQRARQLGFELVERGVIVRADGPMSPAQRDGIRELFDVGVAADSPFVEPGDEARVGSGSVEPYWGYRYDDPSWRRGGDVWLARLVIAGAALALTSLVVAIGLSLAAAEGRDERDVLRAVGARPASMRRHAAARGTVLAMAGIALGVPTGFAPAWVVIRTVGGGGPGAETLDIPWIVVVTIATVVPIVVAAIAWFGSGVAQCVRPPHVSRRD